VAVTGDPRVGTDLAGYRILHVIGHGGASVVYLAEQLKLGRKVALKVLSPQLTADETFRRRFEREWRVAAGLDHPNIVPVHDAGEAEGVLYLAMRYIDGDDLGRMLRGGPLDAWRTISISSQVAGALDAAHGEGLVHRDVKPGNILLAAHRGTGIERAFLADFGLTKRLASTGGGLTSSGQFLGTVDYVAPEQIQDAPIDGRTDVYSLGCVLFHCLTGKPPFARSSEVATIYAHVHDEPPRFTDGGGTALDAVLARALHKDKEHRFPTCSALVEATRSAIERDGMPAGRGEGLQGKVTEPGTVVGIPDATQAATTTIEREATRVAAVAERPLHARRSRRSWIAAGVGLGVAAVVAILTIMLQGDLVPRGRDSALSDSIQEGALPAYSWDHISEWQVSLAHRGESEALLGAVQSSSGELVAVGHADPAPLDEDAAVWSSRDGTHWKRVDVEALAEAGSQRLVDVVEFQGKLVAIGYTSSEDLDAAVWTTTDGLTGWTRVWSDPEPGLQVMRELVVFDGGLLALGWSSIGEETDAAVWTSSDGESWERIHDSSFEGPGTQQMWTGVVLGKQVIALGDIPSGDGSKDAGFWRLEDGTWSMLDGGLSERPDDQEIRDVAIGADGTVVAVGISGDKPAEDVAIWTSRAGRIESWRQAHGRFAIERQQELLAVVPTASGFVAMGWTDRPRTREDALVWLSTDGRHWSSPDRSSLDYLQLAGESPTQEARALIQFDTDQQGGMLVALGTTGRAPNENAEIWIGRPLD
jgi:serine/threonine-protein kinase